MWALLAFFALCVENQASLLSAHRLQQASVLAPDIAEAAGLSARGSGYAPVRSGLPQKQIGEGDALGSSLAWMRTAAGSTAYIVGASGSDVGLDGTVAGSAGSMFLVDASLASSVSGNTPAAPLPIQRAESIVQLAADQRGNLSSLITASDMLGASVAVIPSEDQVGLVRGVAPAADTDPLSPELAFGLPGSNALLLVSMQATTGGLLYAGSTVRLSSGTISGLSTRTRSGDEFGSSVAALHDRSRVTGLPVMSGVPRQAFGETTAEQVLLAVGAPGAGPRAPQDDGSTAGCMSSCGELWIIALRRSSTGHAQPSSQPSGSPWRWEVVSEHRHAPTQPGVPAELAILAAAAGSTPRFGTAVASLGDMDGSGSLEVAVGASGADGGDGAVLVLSLQADGSLDAVVATLSTTATATAGLLSGLGLGGGGGGLGAGLGGALTVVRADEVSLSDTTVVLAVGVPGADEARGVVALVTLRGSDFGFGGAVSIGRVGAGATTDFPAGAVAAARPGDRRGSSLFSVAWQSGGGGTDADGDGATADLMVGGPGHDGGGEDAGAAFVASLALTGVTSGTLGVDVVRVLELSADGGISALDSATTTPSGDGGAPGAMAMAGVGRGDDLARAFVDLGNTALDGILGSREVVLGIPGAGTGASSAVGDGLIAMPWDDSPLAGLTSPADAGAVIVASLVPADTSSGGFTASPSQQNQAPRVSSVSEISMAAGGLRQAEVQHVRTMEALSLTPPPGASARVADESSWPLLPGDRFGASLARSIVVSDDGSTSNTWLAVGAPGDGSLGRQATGAGTGAVHVLRLGPAVSALRHLATAEASALFPASAAGGTAFELSRGAAAGVTHRLRVATDTVPELRRYARRVDELAADRGLERFSWRFGAAVAIGELPREPSAPAPSLGQDTIYSESGADLALFVGVPGDWEEDGDLRGEYRGSLIVLRLIPDAAGAPSMPTEAAALAAGFDRVLRINDVGMNYSMGLQDRDFLGSSIALLGDVKRTAHTMQVALGAPGRDAGGSQGLQSARGAVYILTLGPSGSPALPSATQVPIPDGSSNPPPIAGAPDAGTVANQEVPDSRPVIQYPVVLIDGSTASIASQLVDVASFGSALAAVEVDGDALTAELLVGAPGAGHPDGSGAVFLLRYTPNNAGNGPAEYFNGATVELLDAFSASATGVPGTDPATAALLEPQLGENDGFGHSLASIDADSTGSTLTLGAGLSSPGDGTRVFALVGANGHDAASGRREIGVAYAIEITRSAPPGAVPSTSPTPSATPSVTPTPSASVSGLPANCSDPGQLLANPEFCGQFEENPEDTGLSATELAAILVVVFVIVIIVGIIVYCLYQRHQRLVEGREYKVQKTTDEEAQAWLWGGKAKEGAALTDISKRLDEEKKGIKRSEVGASIQRGVYDNVDESAAGRATTSSKSKKKGKKARAGRSRKVAAAV